ncbi:hypothetical protein ICN49_07850 [Polynucleobacter sp. MWH-Mekk-B1]|uniref:hypothetical protein n=1 Tax=Polynucleobacter finlandensis TaxID=1855894 RepID=UPI001C0BB667|nr:hypothetical protein [Polynucleobacter finlandensis]MBU3544830.1 hypothetical protein [Polynucleobacter finlandensis]
MSSYLITNHLGIIKYAPLIFLLSIIIFLLFGWLYGRYRIRTSKDVIVRDSLATAIFSLSALVLGFTFSGSNDHFNQRMNNARNEAVSIERVYQSSKYLQAADQAAVQRTLREILNTRLNVYKDITVLEDLNIHLDALNAQLTKVNEELVLGIPKAPQKYKEFADKILSPQLGQLLEAFSNGVLQSKNHPPAIIERFLFILLCVGSLLSGYAMAVQKEEDWFLTFLYVGLMGFAILVIFSLEFPNQLFPYDVLNAELLRVQERIR